MDLMQEPSVESPQTSVDRRWESGMFTTQSLCTRVLELLSETVEKSALADRDAGRIPFAEMKEELAETVKELVRLVRNTERLPHD